LERRQELDVAEEDLDNKSRRRSSIFSAGTAATNVSALLYAMDEHQFQIYIEYKDSHLSRTAVLVQASEI